MVYNIVFSPTGGTKKVADVLVNNIFEENMLIDLCDTNFEPMKLSKEDVAVISVPSYGGRIPSIAVSRLKMICGDGTQAILVCVYGNRAYDNTLAEMKDLAEKTGLCPVAAVSAVAEHSIVRELAAGRPDKKDEECLIGMAEQIKRKLDSKDLTPIQVPGIVPDNPISNSGGKMSPEVTDDCIHCGICAEQCPTGAISKENMEADKTKCISCMRCISVCPNEARKLNVVIESLGGVALSVLCSNRKENELFI